MSTEFVLRNHTNINLCSCGLSAQKYFQLYDTPTCVEMNLYFN